MKEIEKEGYTFDFYVDGSAYGLRPKGVKLNELEGYDEEEFSKGGKTTKNFKKGDSITGYFNYNYTYNTYEPSFYGASLEVEGEVIEDDGVWVKIQWESPIDDVDTINKRVIQGMWLNEYAKGGAIKSGDWVTLKSTGKRHKVSRIINSGGKKQYDLIVSSKGGNVQTIVVDENEVEVPTTIYRTKFVAIPTTVKVEYKIGDRVKFSTKKGEETGEIKLYKYIPNTNKILYVIKTDSGWNANVYQDNVRLLSSNTSVTSKPIKKAKPISSGFLVGDKIEVKDAPNLVGKVSKIISADEIEAEIEDTLGIIMKVGLRTEMTFAPNELIKK